MCALARFFPWSSSIGLGRSLHQLGGCTCCTDGLPCGGAGWRGLRWVRAASGRPVHDNTSNHESSRRSGRGENLGLIKGKPERFQDCDDRPKSRGSAFFTSRERRPQCTPERWVGEMPAGMEQQAKRSLQGRNFRAMGRRFGALPPIPSANDRARPDRAWRFPSGCRQRHSPTALEIL